MATTTELKSGFEDILQAGKTAQGNIVEFVNEKQKNVLFPTPFTTVPNIKIDLDADSNSIPYTVNVTTIGFQIKFKVSYTGNVSWSAIKVMI